VSSGSVPLRLLDWRFLLPRPSDGQFQYLVLLGGSVGLAERILEVGFAREVCLSISTGRSADALIALRDAHVNLPEIAGCLAPGGVLYYETERRARGLLGPSRKRLYRAIREAGLAPAGMYAIAPSLNAARLYLPLDGPEAVSWYLATLVDTGTAWQQLFKVVSSAASRFVGPGFAPLAAHCAMIAVAGESGTSIPAVLDNPALPPELQVAGLRSILLTYGGDRVVILPFPRNSSQPAAVLKVPRLPAFNGRTENEHATLRDLLSRLDPQTRRSVPQPLGSVRHGQVTLSIESYASGELLSRSLEKWGVSRHERLIDLELATTWLGNFHRQAELSRPVWGASELAEWIAGPFAAFEDTFGVTPAETELLTTAHHYATELIDTPFPIVAQHRDFTIWNVIRRGRNLTVLDWEGSRPGPALCDLLHFVTHWFEAVDRAHDEPARQRRFRALFFGRPFRDPYHAAAHRAIGNYLERLKMSRRFFPLLLVYTWLELALRRADQQQLQDEAGRDPRAGNRYLPFFSILAEHRESLFANTE
jgi:hypothetical protein